MGPGYLFMAIRRRETLFWNDSLRLAQYGSAQLQTLRTRRVSSKGLFSRVVHIAGVWNCGMPYRWKSSLRPAGAVSNGCRATRSRTGIAGALLKTQRVGRVSEVRVQTMGCFGDSAPKIIFRQFTFI